MPKYRVTVVCKGLTEEEGAGAVPDILKEFRTRPWHADVSCRWSDGELALCATNDYDPKGMALWDEFWDAIHACVTYSGTINIAVTSVEVEP